MFEHKKSPLAKQEVYYRRLFYSFLLSALLLILSLALGMTGYHFLAHVPWIDSFLNASMILTGMGPVDPMPNSASKIFASLYCIYSGVAFLTAMAVLAAPILHRFMHKFHIEEE